MFRRLKYIAGLSLLLTACSSQLRPIHYGQDACDYCRMTIMDPRFGGEIVTKTGMVYKFDSEECLIKYFKEHNTDQKNYAIIAVADYTGSRQLIHIRNAIFVKKASLNSPMAGNIAAFSSDSAMKKAGFSADTAQMTWSEVLTVIH